MSLFLGGFPLCFAPKSPYVYRSKPHFLDEPLPSEGESNRHIPSWLVKRSPHLGDKNIPQAVPSPSRHLKTLRRHLLELPSTTGKDGPGLFLGFCCGIPTGYRNGGEIEITKGSQWVLDLSPQSYFSLCFRKSVILLRSKWMFGYWYDTWESDACPAPRHMVQGPSKELIPGQKWKG